MLFNSFNFLIFFPVVTIVYFLLPHKVRWIHLLIVSCIFYCFFIPVYILILLVTILIDYFAGINIERSSGTKKRAWYYSVFYQPVLFFSFSNILIFLIVISIQLHIFLK